MLLTVSTALCWYMPTYIKLIVAKFRHLIVLLFSNITEAGHTGYVCCAAAWRYLFLFMSCYQVWLGVKHGQYVASSRDSKSCLFPPWHAHGSQQKSSRKQPVSSHMDIMPAFHYSFNLQSLSVEYVTGMEGIRTTGEGQLLSWLPQFS